MTEISILKPIEGLFGRLLHFPAREISEKAKLLWLVKLRWVAIAVLAVVYVLSSLFGALARSTAPIYLGVSGVLVVFNLVSQIVIARSKRNIGPVHICFQLAFDLFVLAALLALSGGFANPFVSLFLLNASLGGILIPGRLSWPFLFLIHTLLGALQFQVVVTVPDSVDNALIATFIVFHFLVLGFWLVMRSLGAYFERESERQGQALVALERQDRLRSIGALAAGFSHEFASPLNVVKIRLERLKRQFGESEDVAEALDAVSTCQNVLRQMNASQMDARDFRSRKVVAGELLADIVESWKEDKTQVRLFLDIEDGIEAELPPVHFAQVVINLLDNAYEANPSGLITLTFRKSAGEFRLSIEDEGLGFDPNVLRHIGEPFVTTKTNGTGLGLYISELFAQSLAGRMEIQNRAGRGAVVTMAWPAKEGGA